MIRQVNQASAITSFCIGLVLNASLIWLILRKSPAEMRVFSRILLQTCFTDLLMLVATLLTQPIFTMDNGISIVVLNGFILDWLHADFVPPNVLLFLWDNCFFFAFFGFSAQFIYRYLLLSRNAHISANQYFGTMFGIVLPLDFLLASLLYSTGYPPPGLDFCCQNSVIMQILNGDNGNQTIRLAQRAGNFYAVTWLIVTACITIAYAIIFYCTFAIVQFVKRNLNENSTGEINQQITRNMLIQSLLPLLTMLPVWFTLTMTLANVNVPNSDSFFLQFMMLIRLPVHWLPVFNPIVTILTVKHYKSAIRRMLLNVPSSVAASDQTIENRAGNLSGPAGPPQPMFHHQRRQFGIGNNAIANMPIISQ